MERRGGKRVGARQEKSPWPKQQEKWINNISEQIMVKYIWKIKLSWPWTFDNDSDVVSFLASNDSSNSEVFVSFWLSLDKFIGEF